MRYTTIGTGSPAAREVSVISLGAMRFGTMTDEATSFAILVYRARLQRLKCASSVPCSGPPLAAKLAA